MVCSNFFVNYPAQATHGAGVGFSGSCSVGDGVGVGVPSGGIVGFWVGVGETGNVGDEVWLGSGVVMGTVGDGVGVPGVAVGVQR